MTEFLFIRHGETPWNVERRVQGWRDIELNETGRQQAQALADFLDQQHQNGTETLDAIYTSDLSRARETAMIVGQKMGLDVHALEGIRERRYGVLEGLLFTKLHEENPAAAQVWASRDPDGIIEGAETLNQVRTRIVQTVNNLAAQHPGQRLAVICHGGVLDILWREASGVPLQDPQRAKLLNASINRIAVNNGVWKLLEWADTRHLGNQSEHDVTV